jgi:hypothetical protein
MNRWGGKESDDRNRKLTQKFIPGRYGVQNSQNEQTDDTVEPNRLRLIMLRLGERYYDDPPASDRIASSVLADLTDSEEPSQIIS